MSTRRFKPTGRGKLLIFILILALIGGGVYYGVNSGLIKMDDMNFFKEEESENVNTPTNNTEPNKINNDSLQKEKDTVSQPVKEETNDVPVNNTKANNETINLSLDEWIG